MLAVPAGTAKNCFVSQGIIHRLDKTGDGVNVRAEELGGVKPCSVWCIVFCNSIARHDARQHTLQHKLLQQLQRVESSSTPATIAACSNFFQRCTLLPTICTATHLLCTQYLFTLKRYIRQNALKRFTKQTKLSALQFTWLAENLRNLNTYHYVSLP